MNWLQWLDIPWKALVVLVSACWILLNYFLGRIHKPHLQLRVSAERVLRGGNEYLIIKVELSNVGLSKVVIKDKGRVATISAHRLPKKVKIVMEPRWEELANIDLYQGQEWVEPNGLLIYSQVVPIPDLTERFLRVWVRFETTRMALTSSVIVAPLPPTDLTSRTMTEEARIKPPSGGAQ